jgi:Fingers domain of DNA polymerase lambda
LTHDLEDRKAKALNTFSHIVGFGHVSSPEFVNRGCLTTEDLRKLPSDQFTPAQQIGLKYLEELETKVPRDEMDVWNVSPLD